jgi:hypothetical protein
MTNVLAPPTRQQFFNNAGLFNAGGFVYTYAAGTSTPIVTYTSTGAPNTNPIILDARGSCDIWMIPNVGYKLLVTDPAGNTLTGYPIDNIYNSQLITLYGGVDTGAANAYIVSFTSNFTSLANGIVLYFIASNTNTGPSTLTVNSFGTQPIISQSGIALTPAQILGGQAVGVMYYNGNWLLISSPSQVPYASAFIAGVTGGVNGPLTCPYSISGASVNITLPYCAFTSTTAQFTLTGLPTSLQPVSNKVVPIAVMQNNGVSISNASASLLPAIAPTVITFNVAANASGWTASGTKGIGYLSGALFQIGVTLAYNLL